ncbi:MAG TPA: hypothetical protein VNZ54_10230 [bacterium]|nr:hypothetical protein [bacterium]
MKKILTVAFLALFALAAAPLAADGDDHPHPVHHHHHHHHKPHHEVHHDEHHD